MLQGIHFSDKKLTAHKKWIKKARRDYPGYYRSGFNPKKALTPYKPCGLEYSKDTRNKFTGVYVYDGGCMSYPFSLFDNYTYSHSDGNNHIYGLCDNASQVLELYEAIFENKPSERYQNQVDSWAWVKELDARLAKERPDSSYCQRNNSFWSGNHIIVLYPMNDFRWHKWGAYIGDYEPEYEYFADEENIDMVYAFDIFKIS